MSDEPLLNTGGYIPYGPDAPLLPDETGCSHLPPVWAKARMQRPRQSGDRMADDLALLLEHLDRVARAGRAEPIRLTWQHWDTVRAALRARGEQSPRHGLDGTLGQLTGAPVYLVDDYEDSTPHVEHWLTRPEPLLLDRPIDPNSPEWKRFARRWPWALKLAGNSYDVLDANGKVLSRGRRPVWWKRTYYRLRMWLA